MPGRNGTGPVGAGAMTGRGFGACAGNLAKGAGLGLGLGLRLACRRGFGGGFWRFSAGEGMPADNRREILQSQKDALKNRLAAIDKQLEGL